MENYAHLMWFFKTQTCYTFKDVYEAKEILELVHEGLVVNPSHRTCVSRESVGECLERSEHL